MTAAPPVLFGPAGFLRSLRGDEAPYPGDLHASTARGDEDASHAVWVDAGLIAEQVWRCDPNGHVLAPIDVARTPSGQAAVLPHCPHRLGVHVEAASRAGEVVTIAVSMLRGAGEASEAGIVCGAWWVDEAGRPVLAAVGSQAWREEGAALLTALATAAFPPLQGALEGAARAMAHDLVSPDELRACEDALFDAADPRPLGAPGSRDADGSMAPRSVVSLRVPASSDPEPSAGSTAGRWLARFTDVEWAGRVTGAIAEVRRVVATPRARRRRTPWITAAVVGLVVVAGGMLWPEGEPAGGVTAHPPTGAAAATSAAAPRHSDAEPLPTDDSDDSDDPDDTRHSRSDRPGAHD